MNNGLSMISVHGQVVEHMVYMYNITYQGFPHSHRELDKHTW